MTDYREQQNNAEFDRLASTLHQFRTTVDRDIHGSVQQENSILNSLEENFSSLMVSVKRTSGQLSNVMNRNTSLTRIVGIILLGFVIIYMLWKLKG
ncbi:protein transport protein Sft1p [Diutina catenulata]